MPLFRLLTGVWLMSALLTPLAHARPPKPADKRHEEALAVGQRALEFYLRAEYRTAAELYRRAAQVEPDEFLYMVGVGKAERAAGRKAEAIAAFEEVLARAPKRHPQRFKAERALAELRAEPPPTAPVLTPAPVPTPAPAPLAATPVDAPARNPIALPPPATPSQEAAPLLPPSPPPVAVEPPHTAELTAGWLLIATGVAAGATAVWLAVDAGSDQAKLDELHLPDGRFDLARISFEDASAHQQSINHRWTGAAVLGGVFLATEVTGIWLVVSGTRPMARLAVTPRGILWTGTF